MTGKNWFSFNRYHVSYEAAVIYSMLFLIYLIIWFVVIFTWLIRWGHKNNLLSVTAKDKGQRGKRVQLWMTLGLLVLLIGLIFILEGIG